MALEKWPEMGRDGGLMTAKGGGWGKVGVYLVLVLVLKLGFYALRGRLGKQKSRERERETLVGLSEKKNGGTMIYSVVILGYRERRR